jgi:spermidine/putrescine transport system permease protein
LRNRKRGVLVTLVVPGAAWLVLMYVVPYILMVVYSFLTSRLGGGVIWEFTLDAYRKLSQFNPSAVFVNDFVIIFLRTFWWGILTVLLSLLVSYPLAFFISRQKPATRNLLIFLVILPFWTNFLVRIYAWKFILGNTGFINTSILGSLGLPPVPLINSPFAVIVGLLYGALPFMVLPLYASMDRFNYSYVEAAQDLGADYLRVFTRIFLPLTVPGIVAGGALVFVMAIGDFVVPVILGGGKVMMVANLLALQFGSAFDWPFGAAIGTVFILLLMLGIVYYIISQSRREI